MILDNKSLFAHTLEHKNPINYFPKHILVLNNLNVICFFQGLDEGVGYYEVWNVRSHQSIIKNNFGLVEQMHDPFEYSDDSIAFLHEEMLQLYIMKYKEAGVCLLAPMRLPTKSFEVFLQLSISDEHRPTYLKSCLKLYAFPFNNSQVIIAIENLSIFDNPTGEVCDDVIVSSWEVDRQIAELVIKKQREPLVISQITENMLILYRQNYFEEKLEFYLWDWKVSTELHKSYTVNRSLNACIQACFGWVQSQQAKIEIKQDMEISLTLEICFCMNSNEAIHPEIFFVTLDFYNHQIVGFRKHCLVLDKQGTMLFGVPWAFPNQSEIAFNYYTKDMRSCIAIYNIERAKKYKLYSSKHVNKITSIQFVIISIHQRLLLLQEALMLS